VIVNTSAIGVDCVSRDISVCRSKHAVVGLTRAAALDYKQGIRIMRYGAMRLSCLLVALTGGHHSG